MGKTGLKLIWCNMFWIMNLFSGSTCSRSLFRTLMRTTLCSKPLFLNTKHTLCLISVNSTFRHRFLKHKDATRHPHTLFITRGATFLIAEPIKSTNTTERYQHHIPHSQYPRPWAGGIREAITISQGRRHARRALDIDLALGRHVIRVAEWLEFNV